MQLSQNPLVSVILPVYNGEKFLRETLESIYTQTYKNMEVIIVDDGSTDRSVEIINTFPGEKVLIRQKNAGVGAARNTAIRHAKGELLAFNDADDIWLPKKTEQQVAKFLAEPDIDVVYSPAECYFPNGARRFQKDKHKISQNLTDKNAFEIFVKKNLIPITASMARKKSVLKVGGFDPTFRTCGDYELWLRMLAADMKFRYTTEVVTWGKKHGGNISGVTAIMHKNRVRAIVKTFANLDADSPKQKYKNAALAHVYAMGAHTFFSARRYGDFLENAHKALRYDRGVISSKFLSRYVRSVVFEATDKLKNRRMKPVPRAVGQAE